MKYVALLRGINVGGNTRVPMADLKKTLEENSFTNVITLLNSGNVIFESDENDEQKVCERVEEILEKKFGWHIFVILRNHNKIAELVKKNPFKQIEMNKNIRRYVSFFKEKVALQDMKELNVLANSIWEVCYVIDLSSVDLPNKKTVDAMADIEKKYGKTNTTTRNWNTVEKLAAL